MASDPDRAVEANLVEPCAFLRAPGILWRPVRSAPIRSDREGEPEVQVLRWPNYFRCELSFDYALIGPSDPISRTPKPTFVRVVGAIKYEFRALLHFELKYPAFHHLMVRENREGSPRFVWLMETFLGPMMRRVAPQIDAAQAQGDLPSGNPVLLYYLLVSIILVPGSLGAEIHYNSGAAPPDPDSRTSLHFPRYSIAIDFGAREPVQDLFA